MKVLNERRVQKEKYVLYWMQASQRAELFASEAYH